MFPMGNFAEWIENQIDSRGWKPADLARASGIRDSSLSKILNETRQAGPDVCRGIARALNLPEEYVFRKAGLLSPRRELDERGDRLLYHFDKLTEEDQELAIDMLEMMAEKRGAYSVESDSGVAEAA